MNSLISVKVMRIFMGDSARFQGKPLHEALVEEARQRGMAGATVSRGFMGFGANSLIHTAKILRLSEDLPVMVEIVDTPARIDAFLPVADGMIDEGSIVVSPAEAVFHLPLRIRDVMTVDVATVDPFTPLSEVVDLLLRRKVKAVPVLEGKAIKGVITGGDLLSRGGMPLSLDAQCSLPAAMRDEHIRCLDFRNLLAKDIMTTPVQTLNIKTRVRDAIQLMAKGNMKRLPVVADDGTLMGIVSRADVLGAIGRASAVAGHLDVLPDTAHGTARDVMYRDVPTASPDTPLKDVLSQIVSSPLRRVAIVDEDMNVLGLVHDRDILNDIARKSTPGVLKSLIAALSRKGDAQLEIKGTARDVMTTDIITIPPDMPLTEVISTLTEHRVKRVLVVAGDGRLQGMVDRDTVLKCLAG
jgi:hypothetical protein